MSKLIEYIKENVSKYGINGDKSFEYIGINIDTDMNYKVYRIQTEDSLASMMNNEPYCSILKLLSPNFLAENKMFILDFSKGIYQGRDTYRIVFSLEQDINLQQANASVNNFLSQVEAMDYYYKITNTVRIIQEYVDTEKVLLNQLGIEVDKEGNVIGIKYYVGIKASEQGLSKDGITELISIISQSSVASNELLAIVEYLEKQDYEPVFVGFSLYGNITESKLYFKSKAFGFQTKQVAEHTNAVFRKYELDKFVSEDDIKKLYDMNLFVRGIAIDLDDFSKWRLYINQLPRKVV